MRRAVAGARAIRSARPVAVGVGDYFHHVTVGVLEIDAATGVQVIDLARLGAPRIGVIPDGLSADAGERRVELGVADKEGAGFLTTPSLGQEIRETAEQQGLMRGEHVGPLVIDANGLLRCLNGFRLVPELI
jgi:hypothetical protein